MMPTTDEEHDGLVANGARNVRGIGLYAATLMAALAVYFLVRWVGEGRLAEGLSLPVVKSVTNNAIAPAAVDVVRHVLLTLAAIVALGHVFGRLFQKLGQPAVIGEVVAGICLGPSVLGAISPDLMHALIPPAALDPHGEVASALKVVAQLGVILYMFVVGLDLNAATLKHQARAAVLISHMSIIVPFLLGSILALWLHASYAPAGTSFTSFSLFMGVAMAITAFPVLARILTDRCMEATPLGAMALACAAADDATAWCLLAVVVGVVKSQPGTGLTVTLGALAFVTAMLLIVKPVIVRWCARLDRSTGPLTSSVVALGLIGVLLASLTTELIGIHAIFGAFLLGAIIPPESRLSRELKSKLKDSVTILMLPAFFAYTGMRTQIGLMTGWNEWLVCLAIIAVATVGKFGGTYAAARATGIPRRDAAALGTLMNTRGLMELIALNIGLDLGVISPTLFAMMVVMALVTTMATSPILSRLVPEFCQRDELSRIKGVT